MTPPSHSSPPKEESSVLFSLNELMDLEHERLADEEAERAAILRAEEVARQQEEHRRREEEHARLEALEAQRRQLELRKREETARIAAIRQGELEKAKREAESAVRLKMMAQSQEHEQRLTAIQQDESKKKLRLWLGLSLTAAILAGVGGGLWVRDTQHRADANLARLAQEAEARQRQFDIEIAELTRQMKQVGEQDAESRRKLQQEIKRLQEMKKEDAKPTPTRGSRRGIATPPRDRNPPPPKEECPPGDPMCPL